MIPITCEHCDKTLRVRDELVGKRIKCPGCGGVISVSPPDEEPAPSKKPAVRKRVVEDEDDETLPDKKKGPPKPSSVLFLVGLGLALVGLILMALFIYFSVMASREAGNKDDLIKKYRTDLQSNPAASDDHKASLKLNIDKYDGEMKAEQSRSTRNMLLAILFGVIFLAGVGLRGYHHMLMKKWSSERVASGKKKKKKPRDDDE